MGILPCRFLCDYLDDKESAESTSHSSSNHHLHSESSLSSQPSLPSVPSLQTHHENPSNAHYCHVTTVRSSSPQSSYISSLVLAGKFLFTATSDGTIRLWTRGPSLLPSGNLVVAAGGCAVKSLVVSGDKLFTGHQDQKIRVWKIQGNTKNANPSLYKCVATLPTLNDRFMRYFLAENYVQVRRHKRRTWVHHVDAVSALAVSNDGVLLYSASWDRTFKVWRTSDFRCLESVSNAHDDAINAVALSDDGHVYTGSADKQIKVWRRKELGKGRVKHALEATLEEHKSAVNALALSSDGSVLYSGACDRSILVWERSPPPSSSSSSDGGDGTAMAVEGALRGHTKAILCLAVVSDLVCSGSADYTVRVWKRGVDRKSYSCLAVLEGHRRPVKSLTAAVDTNSERSPSSCVSSTDHSVGTSYLVHSGSLDSEIKVWRIWVPYF